MTFAAKVMENLQTLFFWDINNCNPVAIAEIEQITKTDKITIICAFEETDPIVCSVPSNKTSNQTTSSEILPQINHVVKYFFFH